MSKPIVSLSFDDGNLSQFKWARGLHYFNITGTFYVNPSMLNRSGKLHDWMLRKMHDEWGHVIANHMWEHKSAKSLSLKEAIDSIKRTDDWLIKNGFEDGAGLLALPYGSVGGRWNEYKDEICNVVKLVRDVSNTGINKNDYDCTLSALGDNVGKMFEILNVVKDDFVYLFYFHSSQNTFDPHFVKFLERLNELRTEGKIDITSMADLVRESIRKV